MWRGQIFWKKSAGYWGDIEKKICDAAMICEGIKFFEKKFRPKLCYVKGSNLLKKIGRVLRWYWNFFLGHSYDMWRDQIYWKKSAGYWGDIKFFFRPQLWYVKGSNLLKKIGRVLRWYWKKNSAAAIQKIWPLHIPFKKGENENANVWF